MNFNSEIIEIIKIFVKDNNKILVVNHKINNKITKINYTIFFNLNQNNFSIINNSGFINRMFTIINNTIIQINNTFSKIVHLSYYFDYKLSTFQTRQIRYFRIY